ncbi:SDR family oxidoreductase [Actinomadura madurae]|uniref:SDR family oxidoreductase n=1 Tax=Actinomadura madurae TaxID=1993 RepID=UPI0020261ACA|nr:NAD(P)H-binding protein [Actinomadura madurae]MCP9950070.1 NAD(P)H-binding protein [Actinomadura madurae]MCP9966834.1 NAD(P)H-binding protein [Actinomadura madurae]MCP9979319.1 NAD(P)H-binding protein [Actinomadura madurae]MCQ0009157.1 NAD(P)H-binding protein [Actinomadura madurae]MCQ0015519.1 NAD(P)H-binding protein [Actinomadura madurae]
MTASILVTGGTGTLGSHVVPLLRAAGRDLRVLSRRRREPAGGIEYVTGDLVNDEGIAAAVNGVETVVHLAGGNKGDDVAAQNLMRAVARADVKHLVLISVIGADRVPLAWLRTQLEVEQAVIGSGVPYTILRAAQFHDLVLKVVRGMAKSPVVPKPGGLRFQPVDARDVAERLVGLALGAPAGRVPDLAGPRVYGLDDLVRGYLEARGGRRRPMLPVRIPGKAGRAYRAGDNLALDGADHGARTWEDFLAERLGREAGEPVPAGASTGR